MLKVFLVEDEIVMREGMKKNIDWEKEGFTFVGDAGDGELAYPMILEKKPDIVITDIRMPFMDGLELSRLVKKELPQTRIILLSGYDEFQYAKEAIEIGITDYLVKPITGAQLVEALKKVEKKIQEERSRLVPKEDNLDLTNLNASKLDKRKLEQFLSTAPAEEVTPYIEAYFQTLGDGNVRSLLLRQYVIMDFYVTAAGFLQQLGYSSDELPKRCGDVKEMALVLEDAEQTKEYLIRLLTTAIELRESMMSHKYESTMLKAKSFIEENYDKDEISLNTVAAWVNLSPNHFSTIFGQETGETFVEYLTRIRMEKAKQLLRTTNMRTTDIAFAVGYRDAHYFSNLFKKTQGCTPREYRSRS